MISRDPERPLAIQNNLKPLLKQRMCKLYKSSRTDLLIYELRSSWKTSVGSTGTTVSRHFAPNSRHTIFVARFSCDKRTQRTLFPRIFPRNACLWTLYLHACYLRSLANEVTSTTNQRHVNWLSLYKYLHPSDLVSPGFTHGNTRNARCFALRYLSTL